MINRLSHIDRRDDSLERNALGLLTWVSVHEETLGLRSTRNDRRLQQIQHNVVGDQLT
jgi:hypothetical protein